MTDPTLPLIARAVARRYGGVRALDGVDLELHAGEVHCLAGANGSGKSTLINILSGVEVPDAGTIEIDGRGARSLTVRDAIAQGIQVIYQNLSLFPNLSVAENIAMTKRLADGRRLTTARGVAAVAHEVTGRLGIDLALDRLVEELPVAERQLVAICRALANEVRVLFMDEPTTALTHAEVERLFSVVRSLTQDGVAVVFVSHKTEEVLAISDRITVLRNGVVTATDTADRFDRSRLVEALVGHSQVDERLVAPIPRDAPVVLRLDEVTVAGVVDRVSLDIRAGEILGLTGLLGSGRGEIADVVAGATAPSSGSRSVGGRRVGRGMARSVEAGIGYVPADRLSQGVFLDQSILRNTVAASLPRQTGRGGVLRPSRLAGVANRIVAALAVKADHLHAPIASLSGGNQQKVVIGKWLANEPKVLVLNGPTVGVDIGSKASIMQIIRELAASGAAVLIASDDLPELVAVCHRVLVVRRGRVVAEVSGDQVTEAELLARMSA